jgi:hypothetical protein
MNQRQRKKNFKKAMKLWVDRLFEPSPLFSYLKKKYPDSISDRPFRVPYCRPRENKNFLEES